MTGAGDPPAPDRSALLELELVELPPLMRLTSGSGTVAVGLLDGPVPVGHPELRGADIHVLSESDREPDLDPRSAALVHGTSVAGILAGRRGGAAAAICPGCRLLVRPIFTTGAAASTTPKILARAICECVDAGARVLNLSVAMGAPSTRDDHELRIALDHAASRGVIVVAAAGNNGTLGSTAITRHPAVIPVVGYRPNGRPMATSNLGASVAKRGVGAPGEAVTSIGVDRPSVVLTGTSLAVPFVTGAIALLWSLFPDADSGAIRHAVLGRRPRISVVPPLLDAWAAYLLLSAVQPTEMLL